MSDDDDRPTPAVVTGAVALGSVPLPFLAVYTLLFLGHGLIHPVHPPDITSTQRGEVIAGCVTAGLFVLLVAGLIMFLNRSRRWPIAILQLAVAATGVYFLADDTKGGPIVSALLLLAAILALVLAFAPDSWTQVYRTAPRAVVRAYRALRLGPRADARDSAPGYSSAR